MVALISVFLGIALILFVLSRMPLKQTVLIEGVLKEVREEKDMFRGTPFLEFQFENYCRCCLEKRKEDKRGSIYGYCFVQIPKSAKQLTPFVFKPGDSVRIIIHTSLFGKILSYGLERTDFAKRFAKELEESTWINRLRRERAQREDVSVEEIKQRDEAAAQKSIAEYGARAKNLGITSTELRKLERETYRNIWSLFPGCIGKDDDPGFDPDLSIEEQIEQSVTYEEKHFASCSGCQAHKKELSQRADEIRNSPDGHRHKNKEELQQCCTIRDRTHFSLIDLHEKAATMLEVV